MKNNRYSDEEIKKTIKMADETKHINLGNFHLNLAIAKSLYNLQLMKKRGSK